VRATGRNDRELRSVLPRLLRIIGDEPNPASRADALLMLIHALSPSTPELRAGVLGLLAKECRDPSNRKRRRQIESAAMVVAADDPVAARELVGLLEHGPKQRAIVRIRDHPEILGPRHFFDLGGTSGP